MGISILNACKEENELLHYVKVQKLSSVVNVTLVKWNVGWLVGSKFSFRQGKIRLKFLKITHFKVGLKMFIRACTQPRTSQHHSTLSRGQQIFLLVLNFSKHA